MPAPGKRSCLWHGSVRRGKLGVTTKTGMPLGPLGSNRSKGGRRSRRKCGCHFVVPLLLLVPYSALSVSAAGAIVVLHIVFQTHSLSAFASTSASGRLPLCGRRRRSTRRLAPGGRFSIGMSDRGGPPLGSLQRLALGEHHAL